MTYVHNAICLLGKTLDSCVFCALCTLSFAQYFHILLPTYSLWIDNVASCENCPFCANEAGSARADVPLSGLSTLLRSWGANGQHIEVRTDGKQ